MVYTFLFFSRRKFRYVRCMGGSDEGKRGGMGGEGGGEELFQTWRVCDVSSRGHNVSVGCQGEGEGGGGGRFVPMIGAVSVLIAVSISLIRV